MLTNYMQGALQIAEKFALTLLCVSGTAQEIPTEISFAFIRCPNSAAGKRKTIELFNIAACLCGAELHHVRKEYYRLIKPGV
jgi:hypothetical protein